MVAKRFFYVSAGILCLALAYHFGAVNATAQAPGNPVVAYGTGTGPSNFVAVTANGDVYGALESQGPWQYTTNIFSGPTPAQRESFGSTKARYR